MERGKRLRKQCPVCDATLHAARKYCGCGRVFPSKRRAQVTSRKGTVKRSRIVESDDAFRKEQDQLREVVSRTGGTKFSRREADRIRKKAERVSETPEQTSSRLEQDRKCKASTRASETTRQTSSRLEQDRERKASKRVLEACDKDLHRKRSLCIENMISAFHTDIKNGADFVCSSCHRMMYKKSVVQLNKSKYTKTGSVVLQQVFSADLRHISTDGKEWVCKTCDRALTRGSMPLQAKANGLQLCDIPPELSGLNALELRLICLRVPFMKMVALPSGKQRSIHGPAVNAPSKVDTICDLLPRLPSQSELVPLKLKRKVAYRGHYMYDYIRPHKLLDALRYLKANNPLYADIDINEQWVEEALANDEELCQYLVEQHDEQMDTECEGDTSGTPNVAVSVQNEPMEECLDDSDEFSTALQQLTALASQSSFIIHNVPYDGDCMFSAISYQLQANDVCSADSSELRKMVANHLEANAPLYHDFLCKPVPSEDGSYSADTAQPTPEDQYINSVPDPQLQTQLRWQKYVRCLRQGAWGDHVTLQAIADMLSVKINVLSSNHPMFSVTPALCSAECEISVGLILQYHYVGLDKLPVCGPSVQQCVQSNTSDSTGNTAGETLDGAAIEEGDEHRRQISGAPMASMMCVENPESSRDIICVVPAEGEKPLNIMTDSSFEAMSNPDKFPFSSGTFSSERPKKLTYRKYFNQRLLDVDGRFARDLDYLFVAQYIVEAKQIRDDGNNFAWRQKPSRQFTAAQARDSSLLSQFVRKDKAYSFMKNIRGSPPYYQRTFYDLLAMIRQLGTPTWFFTLSAADLKWPDMIQTIARQYGVHYTDDEVAGLSFDDKSNWLKRNPVTAARHFQYRLNALFQGFLKSTAKPLGEIADYAIRIEFQARGSPHAHCVIWVKDAPEFGVNANDEVCAFIDQYVSCKLPGEDSKLKELVLLLQKHKHSSYCKRNKTCRFSFPKPPSEKTLITRVDFDRDPDKDLLCWLKYRSS